jgi:hypothetical protein
LSAWPAGRSETAALAANFFLAVAVAFILTPLVSTVSSDCLGFGVGGAAVGAGFAAGVTTALLKPLALDKHFLGFKLDLNPKKCLDFFTPL